MRVLALDYGTARCGCAISDPTGTLVTPLGAVAPPDAGRIAELASEQEAGLVVVGLPVSLGGEETAQARISRDFAAELGALLDVPVETYDERLTTTMAQRSAREGARADEDSLAAAHLLESYLASLAPPEGTPGPSTPGREAEDVRLDPEEAPSERPPDAQRRRRD